VDCSPHPSLKYRFNTPRFPNFCPPPPPPA
jgi:hypothetical protein